ncbi:SusC/RagA family TonB-linked outer membrane protein [Dysgonomonas sp. 521]|uniref:SusC/RagA family TonB-linked outer membrane protein n=1 Tax=Dysgonomonas sp. 521 TaxID=2302932 RepID=UPI0013D39F70|nr:SusC/RagA family TonB-linked outer membrane protein [Dysgonomonas sp. 521]NDV93970.1 SusC/RagA family TonB-linked outer membrane protein [Dysgonomonas sp. 521]
MIYKKFIQIAFLIFLFSSTIFAQDNLRNAEIQGVVKDEYGKPFAGVVIQSEFGKNMVTSDSEGSFSIYVTDKSKYITLSGIGYLTHKVQAQDNDKVEIVMKRDLLNEDIMISDGFSSVSKGTLAGSASTVSGNELQKSPVATLSSTLAGRLSGLTTRENSSEWARIDNSLWIRGANVNGAQTPLIIVDGFLIPTDAQASLDHITPAEIESVTILKDASLLALYGIKGASGALVVTTKRGKPGELKIGVRIDGSMQNVTSKPYRANSADYVRMRNQAAYNDNPEGGMYQMFTEDQVGKFTSGADREHYPSQDWYKEFMKDFSYMQRVGLNLSGGSDKVRFFSNVNMMNQNTNFKISEKEKFNPTPNYFWGNMRTNLDANLGKHFRAFLNIAGNLKREKTTEANMTNVYQGMFDLPPTLYGNVTPEIIDPVTGEIIQEGGKILVTPNIDNNVYGRINRQGYTQHTTTSIYSNFGLELDMSFLTPGLKATGTVGFMNNNRKSLFTTQDYERWIRVTDTPSDWDELKFEKKGTNEDTFLSYSKSEYNYYNLNYKGALDYAASFGKHNVSAYAYAMYQEIVRWENLPLKYIYSGIQASYNYDNRYILSVGTGYSGSDNFAKGNRFHTTPAIAGAWIASNESFLKNVKWLSLLKFKASYGKNANDDTGAPRYPYINNVQGVDEGFIANLNYSPEMVKKQNYGIELGLFDGLHISFDLYRHKMDNMYINVSSNIPSYHGNTGVFPSLNAGAKKNKGYELEASYIKNVNKDLSFNIGGFLSYNKNEYTRVVEEIRGDDYVYPNRTVGYAVGQTWGYLTDFSNGNGLFNSQEELDEYQSRITYSFNKPRLGDIKYKDLNNDGVIDDKDKAPIGSGAIPNYYFALSLGAKYKNFDFSVMFQGVENYKTCSSNTLGINEGFFTDGLYSSRHLKAWTKDRYDAGEEILHPALTLQSASANTQVNDYFLVDRSYLRLKNIEIGYSLPSRISKAIRASNIRISLSAQNLITWDHLDKYDFGPEAGDYNHLPVFRVYNLGFGIQF